MINSFKHLIFVEELGNVSDLDDSLGLGKSLSDNLLIQV